MTCVSGADAITYAVKMALLSTNGSAAAAGAGAGGVVSLFEAQLAAQGHTAQGAAICAWLQRPGLTFFVVKIVFLWGANVLSVTYSWPCCSISTRG